MTDNVHPFVRQILAPFRPRDPIPLYLPEPWTLEERPDDGTIAIRDRNNALVCEVPASEITLDCDREAAKRIVLCVNSMVGIHDPELLRNERDALLRVACELIRAIALPQSEATREIVEDSQNVITACLMNGVRR